jgi:DNA-directed RNA polymerase specialized sigma24 family protein
VSVKIQAGDTTNQTDTTADERPASFDADVLQWLPFVEQMAYKLERNPALREDLVQETIATALHRWRAYNADFSLPNWLVWIMKDRLGSMCRKTRNSRTAGPGVLNADDALALMPQTTFPRPDDVASAESIRRLVPQRYDDIADKLISGYRIYEIAAEQGQTRQAVHARVVLLRKKVAAAMEARPRVRWAA